MQKVFHAVRNRWYRFVEKLEALPLKKFIASSYTRYGCYCAVGSFVREYAEFMGDTIGDLKLEFSGLEKVAPRGEDETLLQWEQRCVDRVVATVVERTGLDLHDLDRVQRWNDWYMGSAEDRYKHVLEKAREESVHAYGKG